MTYDTRKALRGQEYVQEVEIELDACKYTRGDIFELSRSLLMSGISDSYTGSIAVSFAPAGWSTPWIGLSPVYAKTPNRTEVVLIDVVSDTEVTVLARGALGTTPETFGGPGVTVMHGGEADGSCLGFPHTCSTSDSYDESSKLSLIFSTGQNAGGTHRLPGLFHKSVKHDAGEVDPGETIGTRARLSFEIADGVHNDYGIVPYEERRSTAGTMFGKLLARHPYFVGRTVKFREGYRDANTYDAPDFLERIFTIDSASLSKGKFGVTALDPLILTEEKKAKIPTVSPMVLSAAITSGTTTFSYIDAPDYYAGAMSSTAYIRADSEVIKCTVSGAKQFTIVTRGYRSEQKDHEAGVTLQDCVRFSGTHGIDAIEYALQNYTSIDASYIDDYTAVKALIPSFTLDEAILAKPISVVDFINDLVKIGNLIVYFNQVTQKIVINYIPELSAEPIIINESDHIERDSVSIDMNTKGQYTRLTHMWAPVDITKDTEENYGVLYQQVNAALESGAGMGEVNEKKPFKNILLSNSSGDSLQAVAYVDRVLQSTESPPKIAAMTLNAANVGPTQGGDLTLGSIVSLSTSESQDKNGSPIAELYQVLKLSGDGYRDYSVKMRKYNTIAPDAVDFSITENKVNYDLSAEFAPAAGNYVVYISPGVVIGSTSTSTPAFTTGTQASGVTFTIINRGSILGQGGDGGDASLGFVGATGSAGFDGGDAFDATVDCVIDNGSGLIWAGGGGGAGNGGNFDVRYGGGGGQGYYTSTGGINTERITHPVDPDIWEPSGTSAPNGSQSGPGLGSFSGGEWGEAGASAILSGGSAGYSVVKNGNTVTIESGNNEFNIKGAIA